MSTVNDVSSIAQPSDPRPLQIDDFDIVELEDRLELGDRCNNNCDCKPPEG